MHADENATSQYQLERIVAIMKVLALALFLGVVPPPVIAREQLIASSAGIVTEAAEATAGTFIVAGTNASSAWARKFSAEGKTIWEYTNNATFIGYPSRIAAYSGIAPMQDGSTFLCGKSPHDPASTKSSAMLTHVDVNGRRLDETNISPRLQTGNRARLSVFRDCLASGSHVIIQGEVLRVADGASPGQATSWLWFVAVDEKGDIAWQQEVPVTPFFAALENKLMQVGDQIFFSGTNYQKTELVRLSTSGEMQGRMTLGGSYHLVRNLEGEPKVELWGANGGQGQLIRLTNELKEMGRTTGPVPKSMTTSSVYQLSDGTLCLFGSSVHLIGQRIRPIIAHVDATLHTMQIFEPSWNSTGAIVNLRAVAPLDSKGDFVSAVGLGVKLNDSETAIKSARLKWSLALDYIRVEE